MVTENVTGTEGVVVSVLQEIELHEDIKGRVTPAKKIVRRINLLLATLGTDRRVTLASLTSTLSSSTVFVLRKHQSIVGMATISQVSQLGRNNCGIVNDFVLLKSFQGSGFGKILFAELLRIAKKDLGISRIELHSSREPAQKFYKNLGFGERSGSVVMTFDLTS